ncbi:serine hydrolase [Anoxynatronum buryatiense]|uniref:Beta-lactamase class A n=1 Tax=Anoxynatronum buryatiense TaxID=489973 RepID=A0AA46AJR8_9CLOT|nr:serine hydrolase [Anoxynatronum buryatiense]SMP64036.1 beta-lactamase class A [Anoxynatronum buryatiense]
MLDQINRLMETVPGTFGLYYHNLITGEKLAINADRPFLAASVIKLPVLMAVMQEIHEGRLHPTDTLGLVREEKVPSCGALFYMDDPQKVTLKDLYTLMIILSDNTAANRLMGLVGMERINQVIAGAGLRHTRLNRFLFDAEAQRQGKENTFSPADAGLLLEGVYQGTFVSPAMSREANEILLLQQLKNKLRALIPRRVPIAHKTGEDSDMTHDVGIVYARQPFILCLASNDTEVIAAEEAIRHIALVCYQHALR